MNSGMATYERINEPIDVVGSYTHGHFTPKKFRWGQRVLHIDQITLQSDIKDGGVKKRLVSVAVGAELYRLEFNRDSEQWWLREVWVE